jgi:hypothetical protein
MKGMQVSDQTLKGSLLGLLVYLGWKAGLDEQVISLSLPILSAVFAWLSTKIGDPEIASIFDAKTVKPKKR